MESVVLTDREVALAFAAGERRFAWSHGRGWDPGLGPARTCKDARHHIHGIMCEIGAGRILGIEWKENLGRFWERDLAGLIEVRSGREWHHGLPINPTRRSGELVPDWVPYVLAIRLYWSRRVSLPGWSTLGDARRRYPLRISLNADPNYYVPQKALFRLDDLRDWYACESRLRALASKHPSPGAPCAPTAPQRRGGPVQG